MQRAILIGIVVSDHYPLVGHAIMELGGWIAASSLETREEIARGLDKCRETFDIMLFCGANRRNPMMMVASD